MRVVGCPIGQGGPTLIPDRYLIDAFFQKEAKEIEELELRVGEAESALNDAVEAAQLALDYEPDEDESITMLGKIRLNSRMTYCGTYRPMRNSSSVR
jgi:hypothetical protein